MNEPVHLPSFTERELQRRAVAHRNRHVLARDPKAFAATVERSSASALIRWQVNYVRHQYTQYDSAPNFVARTHINEAIADAYPWLADEALRQVRERRQALFFKSLGGK